MKSLLGKASHARLNRPADGDGEGLVMVHNQRKIQGKCRSQGRCWGRGRGHCTLGQACTAFRRPRTHSMKVVSCGSGLHTADL